MASRSCQISLIVTQATAPPNLRNQSSTLGLILSLKAWSIKGVFCTPSFLAWFLKIERVFSTVKTTKDSMEKWCFIIASSYSHILDPNPSVNSLGPKPCSQPLELLDFGVSSPLHSSVNSHLAPLYTRAWGPLTHDTQMMWFVKEPKIVQVHFALDLKGLRD